MTSPALPSLPTDADLEQALLASRVMVDAPEHTILRAFSLLQGRAAASARGRSLLRRIGASLTFDSLSAAPMSLGIRSGDTGSRQLLFTAEGRDIDLRIAGQPPGSASKYSVAGQIFGPDVEGLAELKGPSYLAKRAWNDLSEFRFEDVPPGAFTLVLSSADWQIELPVFELTAGT